MKKLPKVAIIREALVKMISVAVSRASTKKHCAFWKLIMAVTKESKCFFIFFWASRADSMAFPEPIEHEKIIPDARAIQNPQEVESFIKMKKAIERILCAQ